MKRPKQSVIRLLYFFIISVALSACSSLPEHLLKQVESIPAAIDNQQAAIAQKKKSFEAFSSDKEWHFIRPYLEKENWADYFGVADKQLAEAAAYYKSDVLPVAENNDPKDAANLTVRLVLFNDKMTASLASADHPASRMAFLIKVRDTAAAIYQQSAVDFAALKKAQSQLKDKAAKAISKYPHKTTDINQRLQEMALIIKQGSVAVQQLNDEYQKKPAIDYAVFGDASVTLAKSLQQAQDYQKKTSARLDELFRSYTKVLVDQKIKYFIDIGRASWCEGEYCGNGSTIVYPSVQIDKHVFKYFDEFQGELIASFKSRSFHPYIQREIWNALGLQPQSNWPRGDSHAEFWVQKIYTKTYHKYAEIVNDQMVRGQWQAVDEDSFWQQFDNLGMAILTKPYGYYEEDALTDAQPVGMATIAQPVVANGVASGSNQYGSWRHDNGRSFWEYYGMYRMFGDLMIPRRYYYNDWYGYNSYRGGAYYGRNNEYGTWGSGTFNNSRYRNSGYASRNPDDVGRARSGKGATYRSSSSVRGAGVSSRSRGPAGGGK
ncbi:MAG: hypothetical protein OEY36_09490 [Gammaproteobacteria bacterium]|nr:hypothetical protein [Gammaproteobacteria bacterium]